MPRLEGDKFTKLYWLPDPQPDTSRPGHFLPFKRLKGQDTSENYCPSLLSRKERCATGAPPGMLVGQRLRSTVRCDECQKPRGIYARIALSVKDKKELEHLKELVQYTCGSPITTEGSVLHGKVFVQMNIHCSDHVEYSYYACPRKQPYVCCHCAAPNAMQNQQALKKFKVVLPVCQNCIGKPPIVRQQRKTVSK